MARNEKLEARLRQALAGKTGVEEKKMFRGLAFMVDGKLLASAGDHELMFRFDPLQHDAIIKQHSGREMLRNGKSIKGYVYVHEAQLQTTEALDYWTTLALAYNEQAGRTAKKTKR